MVKKILEQSEGSVLRKREAIVRVRDQACQTSEQQPSVEGKLQITPTMSMLQRVNYVFNKVELH